MSSIFCLFVFLHGPGHHAFLSVWEIAATPFSWETPAVFCGPKNLTWPSTKVKRYCLNFLFWNCLFKRIQITVTAMFSNALSAQPKLTWGVNTQPIKLIQNINTIRIWCSLLSMNLNMSSCFSTFLMIIFSILTNKLLQQQVKNIPVGTCFLMSRMTAPLLRSLILKREKFML